VSGNFFLHLQHNWPLALAAFVLFVLVVFALFTGVLPTNQGSILKSREPSTYWRWLRWLAILLCLAIAVLVGSYFLNPR
jgi:drug/metabolite transporter (DMT)-like permease